DMDLFYKQLNSDFIVEVTKDFLDDFNFKGIVGHNTNEIYKRFIGNTAQDFEITNFYDYSNAKSNKPEEVFYHRRLWGVFTDLGFSYKNYIFLNITGRNDWSSTLPKENNSYFYPSAMLSLVLTDAIPSIKKDWLDFVKLRASASAVGSDEEPYQLKFDYIPYTDIVIPFQQDGNKTPHGGQLAYFATTVLPPQNLEPQKVNSWEGGIDADFLDNRLGIDFTYYYEIVKNQIVNISVPPSIGFNAKNINVGAVSNRGIELKIDLTPVNTKNFDWIFSYNFYKNIEKIVELADGVERFDYGSGFNGIEVSARVGESRGLYGRKWKRDTLGNLIINEQTGLRELETESTRLGDVVPDFSMGFSNSFRYKNFNLSLLIDLREGGVIYSGTVQSLRYHGMAEETTINREIDQTFIDKGVNVTYDGNGNIISSKQNTTPVENMEEFWYNYSGPAAAESNTFDASYIKLREIRLSYKFPEKWLTKVFINTFELGVEGRNIWLIKSNVPHIDPEANLFGSGTSAEGIEMFNLPPSRSIGFNVRLTF
ncbi:MAG: TonB-dependent receptor domain-containing protein, partial [bacterium]